MTEKTTTITTIADVVENSQLDFSEDVLAADLVQVVEEAKPVQIEEAKIIKVKPLEAPEYVDPIKSEYIIERSNRIDTPERRNSPDGIAMIHETIRFMGEIILH